MATAPTRLDVRLVPAALTSWIVTAAGIVWPVGGVTAVVCVVLGVASGAVWWRAGRLRYPRWRTVSANLAAAAVVGTGFGCAVALRADAVGHHPITMAFGTVTPVTVTPSESALSAGGRRLMFRATLQRLGG
ncbi:MAG: ComEC/Rec2 family competence protein, partial [Mycobacterium sp.]